MLDGILSFLDDPDHPDDGFVRLDAVRFEEHDAVLDVSVLDEDCEDKWARWQIRACLVRQCSVDRPGGDLFVYSSDHVVVRQHTESRQELYFRGTPGSASATVGRLWGAHREAASDWIPFHRFLNKCLGLEEVLEGGFGLVADGPTFLIEAYSRVLSAEKLNPNALAPRRPGWWNGERWTDSPSEMFGLSIGDSLIVAHSFEEVRLDG